MLSIAQYLSLYPCSFPPGVNSLLTFCGFISSSRDFPDAEMAPPPLTSAPVHLNPHGFPIIYIYRICHAWFAALVLTRSQTTATLILLKEGHIHTDRFYSIIKLKWSLSGPGFWLCISFNLRRYKHAWKGISHDQSRTLGMRMPV